MAMTSTLHWPVVERDVRTWLGEVSCDGCHDPVDIGGNVTAVIDWSGPAAVLTGVCHRCALRQSVVDTLA